jgi:hypothetical protein
VLGEPDVAATWFPADDHPLDPASFDISITVPGGLEAVSNGVLRGSRTRNGRTTWHWQASEPMAPYLAMMAIGQFDPGGYQADGIRFRDAIDPDLFTTPAAPDEPHGPTVGGNATGSFARQPEILRWLSGVAGPYPFSAGRGIVDDFEGLGFALENPGRSTRPPSSPTPPAATSWSCTSWRTSGSAGDRTFFAIVRSGPPRRPGTTSARPSSSPWRSGCRPPARRPLPAVAVQPVQAAAAVMRGGVNRAGDGTGPAPVERRSDRAPGQAGPGRVAARSSRRPEAAEGDGRGRRRAGRRRRAP